MSADYHSPMKIPLLEGRLTEKVTGRFSVNEGSISCSKRRCTDAAIG